MWNNVKSGLERTFNAFMESTQVTVLTEVSKDRQRQQHQKQGKDKNKKV
jgi:hypothetical protein